MTFDVSVTDKAGKPVTGLTQNNFTVLDNGKSTPVLSFAGYDLPAAAAPESVFIVIDDANTDAEDLIVARQQIGKFLTMHEGRLPVPVSLMLLTDFRLRQIAPASQDGNQLRTALDKFPGLLRQMPIGGVYHAEDRFNLSLRALLILSALETKTPGRKLVIWISPGWWSFDNPWVMIFNQQEKASYHMIMTMSRALRLAHITLDAVDPLGMEDANAVHTYLWQSYLKPVTQWQKAQPADLALQVLAAQSGGRVLWGGNNVAQEIDSCMQDAQSWYSVTFAAPKARPDSWHGISVKVDKPGLRVRAPNGYYYYSPPGK